MDMVLFNIIMLILVLIGLAILFWISVRKVKGGFPYLPIGFHHRYLFNEEKKSEPRPQITLEDIRKEIDTQIKKQTEKRRLR